MLLSPKTKEFLMAYPDYGPFKSTYFAWLTHKCLNDPQGKFSVVSFRDEKVDQQLGQKSNFIEIYCNDDKRTPCVAIEYNQKEDKCVLLYADYSFLINFEITHMNDQKNAIYLQRAITNETEHEMIIRNSFSYRMNIDNAFYEKIREPFLSDLFNISLRPLPEYKETGEIIYHGITVRKYTNPIFKIIWAENDHNPSFPNYRDIKLLGRNNEYFEKDIQTIVDRKEYIHFLPLLFSQSICILRLIQQLSDIQNSNKYFNDKQYELWKLGADCKQERI